MLPSDESSVRDGGHFNPDPDPSEHQSNKSIQPSATKTLHPVRFKRLSTMPAILAGTTSTRPQGPPRASQRFTLSSAVLTTEQARPF